MTAQDVYALVHYMPGSGWWTDLYVDGARTRQRPAFTHVGARRIAKRWVRKAKSGRVPTVTDQGEVYR